jgi:glycine cleavage system H lipoate-binding protein
MTIILLLLTFLVFIVLDLVLNRYEAKHAAPQTAADTKLAPQPVAAPEPQRIAGFALPSDRQYHPGHGWALRERKNVLRVGLTEFAAKLLGRIDAIDLPKPGHWLRQGQGALDVHRAGQTVKALSPVEGEVLEVNPEIARDPSIIRRDPYGAGWLFTVFCPDEENTRRNLLPAPVTAAWMKEAAERLYSMQPQLAGAVAADGGLPVEDLAAALPEHPWDQLAAEFLLASRSLSRRH